jgi:hypothetical protein
MSNFVPLLLVESLNVPEITFHKQFAISLVIATFSNYIIIPVGLRV